MTNQTYFAIGPAHVSDLPRICTAAGTTAYEHAQRLPDQFDAAAVSRSLERAFTRQFRRFLVFPRATASSVLVVRHNNQFVGYTFFTKYLDTKFIQDIYVVPEFRGKGVATKLLEAVIQQPRTALITAVVWRGNEASHALFQNAKFGATLETDTSTRYTWKRPPFDRKLDGRGHIVETIRVAVLIVSVMLAVAVLLSFF